MRTTARSPSSTRSPAPPASNTITIDEDVLNLGSIECPNCGETLEFEGIEEDEDEPDDDGEDKD